MLHYLTAIPSSYFHYNTSHYHTSQHSSPQSPLGQPITQYFNTTCRHIPTTTTSFDHSPSFFNIFFNTSSFTFAFLFLIVIVIVIYCVLSTLPYVLCLLSNYLIICHTYTTDKIRIYINLSVHVF